MNETSRPRKPLTMAPPATSSYDEKSCGTCEYYWAEIGKGRCCGIPPQVVVIPLVGVPGRIEFHRPIVREADKACSLYVKSQSI